MKTFIVACVAAAVIAIGAVVVLNSIQKPVECGTLDVASHEPRSTAAHGETCRKLHDTDAIRRNPLC